MSFDPAGPYDVSVDDVEYTRPDGTPLLARVYRPALAGHLPALVDVHGGAWTYFDRHADTYFDRALAACGVLVVALDFRQGPAHRYPTAVADIVAGIRWTKARADVRAGAVGLVGGSSGGHLLMLAALRPSAAEYATTAVDVPPWIDARVAFALPLWPIMDPSARYRYLLARRAEPAAPSRDRFFQPERLIEGHHAFFGDENTMTQASAQRIVEAGEAEYLPTIWIAHPELDENVTLAMTERFVAAYRAAGGRVELEVFAGVGHGFANFPGEVAERCIAGMRTFVGRQLDQTQRPVP